MTRVEKNYILYYFKTTRPFAYRHVRQRHHRQKERRTIVEFVYLFCVAKF